MEWIAVAGTLFGALIGWLAGLTTARWAAKSGRETAFDLLHEEQRQRDLDARSALAEELRTNVVILAFAFTERPAAGRVQRVAWHAAIGLRFTPEVRKALQDAYASAAVLDALIDKASSGVAGSPGAEAKNDADSCARATHKLFVEADRIIRG